MELPKCRGGDFYLREAGTNSESFWKTIGLNASMHNLQILTPNQKMNSNFLHIQLQYEFK